MKINSLSLPHPVLGVNQDIQGKHFTDIDVFFKSDEVHLDIKHTFLNKTLQDLVKKGEACLITEIHCSKTLYRETFESVGTQQKVIISQSNLRDKVDVYFFIVAKDNIDDYRNKTSHPDYNGCAFQVEKGDVLSYGGYVQFVADKKWQMGKSVSSVMIIEKGDKKTGPMGIDLSGDIIVVRLSINDHDAYKESYRSNEISSLYLSSIVLPVIMFALSQIMSPDESEHLEELKWCQALMEKRNDNSIRNLTWDPHNIPQIAQAILDNPVEGAMSTIKYIVSQKD